MEGIQPPSYEETFPSGPSHSASSINAAFETDERITHLLQEESAIRAPLLNLRSLTDEQLREACHAYIQDTCCYGSRFIRDMVLTDIYNDSAFIYTLESYGEKRQSAVQSISYYGQLVDGIENGPIPDPWDVPVTKPAMFTDHRTTTEIPHTAFVKFCSACVGDAATRCESCNGEGSNECVWCLDRGERGNDNDRCWSCDGTGRKTCIICNGGGVSACNICNGTGKLKDFRLLTVSWTNHKDVSISNTFNLPKELIQEVSGHEIFKEQYDEVSPVSNAVDTAVIVASASLLREHRTSFPHEYIIQQRHSIHAVPFTKASYIWRRKKGEFYVYGFQNTVYFEEYPQKYCCCACF